MLHEIQHLPPNASYFFELVSKGIETACCHKKVLRDMMTYTMQFAVVVVFFVVVVVSQFNKISRYVTRKLDTHMPGVASATMRFNCLSVS